MTRVGSQRHKKKNSWVNCHYLILISLKIILMCDVFLDVVLGKQVECIESSHVGIKVAGGDS